MRSNAIYRGLMERFWDSSNKFGFKLEEIKGTVKDQEMLAFIITRGVFSPYRYKSHTVQQPYTFASFAGLDVAEANNMEELVFSSILDFIVSHESVFNQPEEILLCFAEEGGINLKVTLQECTFKGGKELFVDKEALSAASCVAYNYGRQFGDMILSTLDDSGAAEIATFEELKRDKAAITKLLKHSMLGMLVLAYKYGKKNPIQEEDLSVFVTPFFDSIIRNKVAFSVFHEFDKQYLSMELNNRDNTRERNDRRYNLSLIANGADIYKNPSLHRSAALLPNLIGVLSGVSLLAYKYLSGTSSTLLSTACNVAIAIGVGFAAKTAAEYISNMGSGQSKDR